MLNKGTLVLEGVALAQVVELVVEVFVDLAGGAVFHQQAAEDTQTTHPHNLTVAGVSPVPAISHSTSHPRLSPNSFHQSCDTQNPNASHGVYSRRHSGVGRTLSLTETPVSADTTSGSKLPGASTRVHGDGLADDEAICDELADGLAGVGVGDLVHFVRVEPDLALAAVGDGRRQALLSTEVDPTEEVVSVRLSIRHAWAVSGGRGDRLWLDVAVCAQHGIVGHEVVVPGAF